MIDKSMRQSQCRRQTLTGNCTVTIWETIPEGVPQYEEWPPRDA